MTGTLTYNHGAKPEWRARWKVTLCHSALILKRRFQMQSAAGGTRTRTGFPPADFKSAASAISPQRLRKPRMYRNRLFMGSASMTCRSVKLTNIQPSPFSLISGLLPSGGLLLTQ